MWPKLKHTFILVSHLCDRGVAAQMPSRRCFLICDAKQFPGTQLASQTPMSVGAMKGQTSPSWCCDSQARLVWYLQRKTEAGRTELALRTKLNVWKWTVLADAVCNVSLSRKHDGNSHLQCEFTRAYSLKSIPCDSHNHPGFQKSACSRWLAHSIWVVYFTSRAL